MTQFKLEKYEIITTLQFILTINYVSTFQQNARTYQFFISIWMLLNINIITILQAVPFLRIAVDIIFIEHYFFKNITFVTC